jgi:hypothetical protein
MNTLNSLSKKSGAKHILVRMTSSDGCYRDLSPHASVDQTAMHGN